TCPLPCTLIVPFPPLQALSTMQPTTPGLKQSGKLSFLGSWNNKQAPLCLVTAKKLAVLAETRTLSTPYSRSSSSCPDPTHYSSVDIYI
uniref:Uncharacterized protein n=1 Tax=Malurus cyaneus samueli TaxID=2593467 RepID=A0A8C5TG80_9PASS